MVLEHATSAGGRTNWILGFLDRALEFTAGNSCWFERAEASGMLPAGAAAELTMAHIPLPMNEKIINDHIPGAKYSLGLQRI